MKKIVLYCLTCILFTTCIKENRDDCYTDVRFIVTYEHSSSEFDARVANDVYFQIYDENDVLTRTDVVPYEAIRGGQEYVVRDYQPGTYRVVGWAVPSGETDVPDIPAAPEGLKFPDQSISMSVSSQNNTYYDSMGPIFLGDTIITLVKDVSSRHEVSVRPCIANVYFTLYNGNLLNNEASVWIELEAGRSVMMVDRKLDGEDVTVYEELAYNSDDNTYASGRMGVLPSDEDQYLAVNLYNGTTPILRVETTERAVAGTVVEIEATIGSGVDVYVNGWRTRDANIIFY